MRALRKILRKYEVPEDKIPDMMEDIKSLYRDRITRLPWIKILQKAVDGRPSSWGKDPIIEWRNASDQVWWAVIQAMQNVKLLDDLLSVRSIKKVQERLLRLRQKTLF